MTIQEWLNLLNDNRKDIESLIYSYHPHRRDFDEGTLPITAHRAEAACEVIRNKIQKESKEEPLQAFREAELNKDYDKMRSILGSTWFGVPESYSAHAIPGFGVLCDLCSEYEGDGEL